MMHEGRECPHCGTGTAGPIDHIRTITDARFLDIAARIRDGDLLIPALAEFSARLAGRMGADGREPRIGFRVTVTLVAEDLPDVQPVEVVDTTANGVRAGRTIFGGMLREINTVLTQQGEETSHGEAHHSRPDR